jgi:two-component system, chemotaxis family, chemotaxis protein CheY
VAGRTCLIVDDSRVVRKVARRILEELGFACDEAEDGKQALEAVSRAQPTMVLLDWNMPVMNGLEFLKALRAQHSSDAIKVVMCTTENDMNHIMEAMQSGANEYIMKPFDKEILEAKLGQIGLA